eukprot:gb/GECG01008026.1/.p1 GENE.gb/GECG01008026.1/~~gb/GECG01008026.1/.p1  ORF type:complete len:241 (+),score=32.78 gb/GECG01008026.1/:1-723(+)
MMLSVVRGKSARSVLAVSKYHGNLIVRHPTKQLLARATALHANKGYPGCSQQYLSTSSSSEGGNERGEGNTSRTRNIFGFTFFGSLVALTAYLGQWQTRRYFWKTNLMEERRKELEREPRAMAEVLSDEEFQEILKDRDVVTKARIDSGKPRTDLAMYVGPRPPPQSPETRQGGMASSAKEQGYYLVLPVEFDCGFILMKCGWIGASDSDQELALSLPSTFTQDESVEGMLHHGETVSAS